MSSVANAQVQYLPGIGAAHGIRAAQRPCRCSAAAECSPLHPSCFSHRRITLQQIRLGITLPADVLIVGAQKAGTTALFSHLLLHPQIAPGRNKEVRFFYPERAMSINEYVDHMSVEQNDDQYRNTTITGEASPAYMLFPHSVRGIAKLLPWTRLLVVLRDPTMRFLSQYRMKSRREGSSSVLPLGQTVEMEMDGLRQCLAPCEPPVVHEEENRSSMAHSDASVGGVASESGRDAASFNAWLADATAIVDWDWCVRALQLDATARRRGVTVGSLSPTDRVYATESIGLRSSWPGMPLNRSAIAHRAMEAMRSMARRQFVCHADERWADATPHAAKGMQLAWGTNDGCWPKGTASPFFLARGIYVEQVATLFEWFRREQVLFLTDTELRNQPAETMRRVTSFLGLAELPSREISPRRAFRAFHDLFPAFLRDTGWTQDSERTHSESTEMHGSIERRLRQFYAPFNRALYRLIGRDLGWERTADGES